MAGFAFFYQWTRTRHTCPTLIRLQASRTFINGPGHAKPRQSNDKGASTGTTLGEAAGTGLAADTEAV